MRQPMKQKSHKGPTPELKRMSPPDLSFIDERLSPIQREQLAKDLGIELNDPAIDVTEAVLYQFVGHLYFQSRGDGVAGAEVILEQLRPPLQDLERIIRSVSPVPYAVLQILEAIYYRRLAENRHDEPKMIFRGALSEMKRVRLEPDAMPLCYEYPIREVPFEEAFRGALLLATTLGRERRGRPFSKGPEKTVVHTLGAIWYEKRGWQADHARRNSKAPRDTFGKSREWTGPFPTFIGHCFKAAKLDPPTDPSVGTIVSEFKKFGEEVWRREYAKHFRAVFPVGRQSTPPSPVASAHASSGSIVSGGIRKSRAKRNRPAHSKR